LVLRWILMGGRRPERRSGEAVKPVDELHGYLQRNQRSIPNYAERHRAGEPVSSAATEATVNSVVAKRMVKKQLTSPNL
jgi:hypothetical protein